jgi:hypothetical protein
VALTLSQVDQAIQDILLYGQAVTADGGTLTRANLDSLRSLRKELQSETADSPLDRANFVVPRRS